MQELSHNKKILQGHNWVGAHGRSTPPPPPHCEIKFMVKPLLFGSVRVLCPPIYPVWPPPLAKTFRYGSDSIVHPPRQNPTGRPPAPSPPTSSLPYLMSKIHITRLLIHKKSIAQPRNLTYSCLEILSIKILQWVIIRKSVASYFIVFWL